MRVQYYFLAVLLFGIMFLGANMHVIRKTGAVEQVDELEDVEQVDEPEAVVAEPEDPKPRKKRRTRRPKEHLDKGSEPLPREPARTSRTELPPPKYMVVALHSNVNVFPDIIMQVLPQLTNEWTAWFVSANRPGEPEKDWSAVYTSKAYEELMAVAHSVVFRSIETDATNHEMANTFAFNHKWWNATPTSIEYIWLTQSDAAVCTTNTKWCIHDFLGWDYLGAPWTLLSRWGMVEGPPYGNGGFSIRSRRLQVECTRPDYFQAAPFEKGAEDRFFSYCLRDANMHFRVAPVELARKFSSDRPLVVGSFGWHLPSRVVTCNDDMIRYCPEALSSYKRWGCGVPGGVPPVNITFRCRTPPNVVRAAEAS